MTREHAPPAGLIDIQHTVWMIGWQERSDPAPDLPAKLFLLAAPPEPLLLTAGAGSGSSDTLPRQAVVFDAAAQPSADDSPFTTRLLKLRSHIERRVSSRWYDEFDPYERDNLVQAGLVHLWQAYTREPALFDERGDGYWVRTAQWGAKREVAREYRQRYRQVGTGSSRLRTNVETVINAGDLLAARMAPESAGDDLDETVLDSATVYGHDTAEVQQCDRRIDLPRVLRAMYRGTDPVDHPRITRILDYMREGLSVLEMARQEDVKPATIRCTIRRMRQACGAVAAAKANKRRDYGDSKDVRIKELREQGCSGPEIARLTGTGNRFVYARLKAMGLMET